MADLNELIDGAEEVEEMDEAEFAKTMRDLKVSE